jgi:hypothetical protein
MSRKRDEILSQVMVFLLSYGLYLFFFCFHRKLILTRYCQVQAMGFDVVKAKAILEVSYGC